MEIVSLSISGEFEMVGDWKKIIKNKTDITGSICLRKLILNSVKEEDFPVWLALFKNLNEPMRILNSEIDELSPGTQIIPFSIKIETRKMRRVILPEQYRSRMFVILPMLKNLFAQNGLCNIIKYNSYGFELASEQAIFLTKRFVDICTGIQLSSKGANIEVVRDRCVFNLDSEKADKKRFLKNIGVDEMISMMKERHAVRFA